MPRRTATRRTGPSFGFVGALVGICVLAVGGAALIGRRGGDPGTLPQTEGRPTTTSPGFQARMRALWQGITTDDADAALPAFFPITAYRQVKAISNPDGDFNSRLIPAYREDVRTLFGRLGAQAAGAQLLGVDVPENATWVPPGDEYNKGSYWRVYGATLRWSTPDGRTGTFPITAMISWRGEWYVVHLGPIR